MERIQRNNNLITFILGTRPEAIKLAPVIKIFQKDNKLKTRIILTGQHKEMVSQVMDIFSLKEDKDLNIMKKNQTLIDITKNVINNLEDEFNQFKPNLVLVQGDTTSALASSIASFYNSIPIGHIEAGLRTNNLFSPFPEEANRRLISQISNLHFAPTENSLKNLKSYGITENVFMTGNTVVDSLKFILKNKKFDNSNFYKLDKSKKIILATFHRRENWGENIENFSLALKESLNKHPNLLLLLPLHKNTKVRQILIKLLKDHPRVILTEPLDYLEFINLMKKSYFVITDSGGIQEEAPSLGKPVLILRENTEREEAVNSGNSVLVGIDKEKIIKHIDLLMTNENLYKSMSRAKNPFGDGNASQKILKICKSFLNL